MFKKINYLLSIFILVMSFLIGSSVMAYENYKSVNQDEVIYDNFYVVADRVDLQGKFTKDVFVFGSFVEINGDIDGDLIVVGANSLKIGGKVNGNIWLIGNRVNLDGEVSGSVRGIGTKVDVDNSIGHNLFLIGNSLNVNSQVNWHTVLYGQRVKVDGNYQRIDIKAQQLNIFGIYEDSVYVELYGKNSWLDVGSGSLLNNGLIYSSFQPATLSDSAQIQGETKWNKQTDKPVFKIDFDSAFGWLVSLFGYLVVGLIMITWFPRLLDSLISRMTTKPAKHFLRGLITLVAIPITVVILFITVIGFPLAIILLLLYGLVIYFSQLLAALWLGEWLAKNWLKKLNFLSNNKKGYFWRLIFGLVILKLVMVMPIIGWLIEILTILWMLGTIVLVVKEKINLFK